MKRNQELSLEKMAKVNFKIQEQLQKNYDLTKGERIIGIQIKVTVGEGGKINKEEFISFMDEYNKLINEEDIKDALESYQKTRTRYSETLKDLSK